MGLLTKGLLLVAVVVPVTAYVTSSLASPTGPQPADHSPVILRDAPTREPRPAPTPDPPRTEPAEVVTPKPTPIGEDDDDEWDDEPDDDREDDDTETEQDDD